MNINLILSYYSAWYANQGIDETEGPNINKEYSLQEDMSVFWNDFFGDNIVSYFDSGYRISPAISFIPTALIKSCVITWEENIPIDTSLIVQYALSKNNSLPSSNDFININNKDNIIGIESNDYLWIKQILYTSDQEKTPKISNLKLNIVYDLWGNNPYRIEQIGEWTYFHNDNRPDPLITTHSEAFWRAKYELMNRLGYTEKISLQIAPNYLHDASDVIAIIDEENNVSGRYLIESFNIPIIPDLLTIETRKERRIIDDWDFVVTEYGDIVGKVTNVSEEELEGVKLVLTSVTTGYSDTVHSNFFGNYRFIKVPEANDYVVTASLEDYQEKTKSNIKVEGGIITEVDLEMVV